jgi:hypothetical protein
MQKSIFDPTKDFSGLKYNVFATSPEKVVGLSVLGVDKIVRPDKTKLIRYVMAMYDQRSPLIKSITDINQRKREAAIVSGYDLSDAKLKAIFDFTDEDLVNLVLEFLKDQNSFYWSMIVSNEQAFLEYQKALLSEVSLEKDKDKLQSLQIKGKLMEECHKIAERVEGYYAKIFGDKEVSDKAKEKNRFTPEMMANR